MTVQNKELQANYIQLQQERGQFQAIWDAAVASLVVVNESQEVVLANRSFLDMLELEASQKIVGVSVLSLLGCENCCDSLCDGHEACFASVVAESLKKLFASGRASRNIELRLKVSLKGREIYPWLRINVSELNFAGRKALLSIENITKYKELEADLMQYWNLYLTFFENFPNLIWRSGLDGRCDYFNKSWLVFTGKTLEQETKGGWSQGIHPEDRSRCQAIYTGNFEKRQGFELEYRRLRHDGQYRWVMDMGKPFTGLDGVFAGYIGSVYDITERKIAIEGLKRYELLAENASDIILFTDSQGDIIDANSAALRAYGYSREEILKKTVFDLRRSRAEQFTKILKEIEEADRQAILFETTHHKKNGESFPVEVSSQGTDLGDRRVILSIIRDISDRKKIELIKQKAITAERAANRAKSEFLANMSHEIRTPLNGILGMIDLTLIGDPTPDQRENLTIAKTCANSLLKIIDDVLDFSKMEAGKVIIEKINFLVRDTFESVVKAHAVRAESKGIELYYQFAANLPQTVVGDPHRLQQVLNNLLGNAVKFTEQGKVTLSVCSKKVIEDQIDLLVSVADSGIGISTDERLLLFQSFSQVDGSHTRKYGGTGLGLAISKQLVELMGGTISVESVKGKGSTFSFTVRCTNAVAENVKKPAVAPKTKKGLKLLLAEDNLQNQIVLKMLLKELGHQVTVVNNGFEVLDILKQEGFDAILMDIQMPEMDGMETTLAIRAQEEIKQVPYIPIIALTAHALQGDRERFLALGMDEYLSKPVSLDTLEALMSELQKNPLSVRRRNEDLINQERKEKISNPELKQLTGKLTDNIEKIQSIIAAGNLEGIEFAANEIKQIADQGGIESIKNLAFKIALTCRRGLFTDVLPLIVEIENELKSFIKVRLFVEK